MKHIRKQALMSGNQQKYRTTELHLQILHMLELLDTEYKISLFNVMKEIQWGIKDINKE